VGVVEEEEEVVSFVVVVVRVFAIVKLVGKLVMHAFFYNVGDIESPNLEYNCESTY
jgi:hypothetical protein